MPSTRKFQNLQNIICWMRKCSLLPFKSMQNVQLCVSCGLGLSQRVILLKNQQNLKFSVSTSRFLAGQRNHNFTILSKNLDFKLSL